MSPDPLKKYRGVIAPLLTPFNEDKSIDYDALEKHVNWLADQPLNMIFVMGGSGEYQTLELEEKKKLARAVVDIVKGRVLVSIGSGGNNLEETIQLSQYAAEIGADGIGVVLPTFIPGTQEAIFNYYKAVDQAVSIPMMIYDPRGEGDHSILPKTMLALIEGETNIQGIKYRTVNGERMGAMAVAIGDKIALLSGAETVYIQDLGVGAVGCVGGGGNFYPGLMQQLQSAFEDGNIDTARKIQHEIMRATSILDGVYWPLSGKVILNVMGFGTKLITRVKGEPVLQEKIDSIKAFYKEYPR